MSRNATSNSNLSQHHLQHHFYILLPSCSGGNPGFRSGDVPIAPFKHRRPGHHFFQSMMSLMSPIILRLEVWLQIQILAIVTSCTSDLHYLALKPRYDGARAMATALPCSHANAMPDLWRTSLVEHGISLAEHATLAWIYSRGFLRLTLKSKNGATEPSWVKIRSSTGPWETRVPAAPVQLLLLSFPFSAASCCTERRKVLDPQCSSRTALAVSVVHLLTEIMSWPR